MIDSINAEDIFNANDFKSFKLEFIEARNLTTNTPIKDRATMTLEEFTDRSLVLQLKEKSASIGHNLMLSIQLSIPTAQGVERAGVDMTCRIQSIENLGDGFDRATVTLVQYEEKIWMDFLSKFENRQNQIMEFFKAAKG